MMSEKIRKKIDDSTFIKLTLVISLVNAQNL